MASAASWTPCLTAANRHGRNWPVVLEMFSDIHTMTISELHHVSNTPAAVPLSPADGNGAGGAMLINAAEADALPTSFGVFKPVGHVMTGLPTPAQVAALVAALHSAGWPGSALRQFSPRESVAELREMIENAGALAGFGYEITLLRRYMTLAEAGYQWLLVKVEDSDRAAAAARLARDCGATLAVYYRTLTVEELIT